MKNVVIVMALLAAVAGTYAADAPSSLTDLKGKYEKSMASIAANLAKQQADALQNYGKALDAVIVSLKQKGDIDAYGVVDAERKRFQTEKSVSTNAPSIHFSDAVNAYRKQVKTAEAERDRRTVDSLKQYIAALNGLIKDLMAKDKIGDAKTAGDVKKSAEFLLADMGSRHPQLEKPKLSPDVDAKSSTNDVKQIKKRVPGNATEFQGHHYLFIENKKASKVHRMGEAKKSIGIPTWTEAQAECEKMGGHLVILNDAKTFEFARTLAELGKGNRVWVGLRRLKDDGAFKWIDETDVRYAGWCPWQPAKGPGMRYVSMGVGWEFKTGWNVEFDSAAVTGYICEWDY